MRQIPDKSDLPALLLIAAISFSLMVSEVTLLRVLSFLLFREVVSLAIALPMLGLGIAGSLQFLFHRSKGKFSSISFRLSTWVIGYCLTSTLFFRLAAYIAFDLQALNRPGKVLQFGILLISLTVPFFFGGMIICELLAERKAPVALRYGVDLVAAATGAGAAVFLLQPLGAPLLLQAVSGVVAIMALPLIWKTGKVRRAIVGFLGLLILGSSVIFLIRGAPDIPLPWKFSTPTPLSPWSLEHHWTPLCRIDLTEEASITPSFGGGLGKKYAKTSVRAMGITQDATAPTFLIRLRHGDPKKATWATKLVQALPYQAKRKGDVAIIGAGGGPDILTALANRAKTITAIEVNPVLVHFLSKKYAKYTGNLIQRKNVKLINADGRQFMVSTTKTFDTIQLSGVDTYTSGMMSSLAMTENFLYTREGIDLLFHRLKPGGVLSYSRWYGQPANEILRLVNTMVEVLRDRKLKQLHQRFVIIAQSPNGPWADVLMKNGTFTKTELKRISIWAKKSDLYPVYIPGKVSRQNIEKLFSKQRSKFVSSYYFDIRPSTDDWPFFFNFFRVSHLFQSNKSSGLNQYFRKGYPGQSKPLAWRTLFITFVILMLFGLLFILGPLWLPWSHPASLKKHWPILLYASVLGFGFILFELAAIHHFRLFLGTSFLALSVALTALLLFTGIGSWFSGRYPISVKHLQYSILGALGSFAAFAAFAYSPVASSLVGQPLPVRITIAFFVLAPSGFFLGIPLPTFLRAMNNQPGLVAWAWAINAFCSVVAATGCTILAQVAGYKAPLFVAFACYIAAFLLSKRLLKQAIELPPNEQKKPLENHSGIQS